MPLFEAMVRSLIVKRMSELLAALSAEDGTYEELIIQGYRFKEHAMKKTNADLD